MSFARYPSLEQAAVFITGGASGIGAEIVRAFADQGARVGFVDLDEERGGALAAELAGAGATVRFEACDLRDIEALKRAFAALEAAAGAGDGAGQQRRAGRPPRLAGGRARLLRRAHRDQPAAHVLRHPGGGARHDRGGQGLDHQLRLQLLVGGRRRHAGLHHGQGGGARHDPRLRPRPGAAPHPGQHRGARLGHDRAPEGALGDPRIAGAAPPAAVPAGPDRAGLPGPHGAVPGLRRRRHVHR